LVWPDFGLPELLGFRDARRHLVYQQRNTMSAIVRAVDVGFGNTKYVVGSEGGRVDCAHFPSLTFYSHSDRASDALGGKRKTVSVSVDGLFYEVGPDVELAADRFRARTLHDKYTETPEYRALVAGALHFMKTEVVDLLVVGLPVAQFLAKRSALERSMTGTFDVGRKRKVVVKRALVVAQPQGALMSFAADNGQLAEVKDSRNLVIDVGARTFDWLVTRGVRVVPRMSHSVTRGVSDILRLIAQEVGLKLREDYQDLEAIDRALRSGKSLRIYQKAHDLKQYDNLVQKVADEAVSTMLQHLDNTHAFENVVLVGGGAFLFKKAVRGHFEKLSIHEGTDPIHANVRGFQLIGEQWARERPELFAANGSTAQPAGAARESV
jgi:plasmid segregation protein ParM